MTTVLHYTEDIHQAIKACILLAIKTSVANGSTNLEHARGLLDMAHTLSVFYKLDWKTLVSELRAECGVSTLELLESSLKHLELPS